MPLTYDGYLAHYGVKGMKWGVRNDEKDAPGKISSRVKDSFANAKDERIARYEGDYLTKGNTPEEAHRKAVRKENIGMALRVTGAVAATAAVAYVGTHEFKKRFQSVNLPAGAELHNVNIFGEELNIDRRLYVSYKSKDAKKYRDNYRMQLGRIPFAKGVYETTLNTTSQVKAPSHHQAKKLFKEFAEKENLGKNYKDYIKFNQLLVNSGANTQENAVNKKFYDFVKSKGYNAILDANDQFESGYSSEKPLILLNAKNTAKAINSTKLDPYDTNWNAKVIGKQLAKGYAKQFGVVGGVAGALKANNNLREKQKVDRYLDKHKDRDMSRAEAYSRVKTVNNAVDMYYREHPFTTMTQQQVFNMLDKQMTHSELTYDDYLMHYGVKGMRWGHRKQALRDRAHAIRKKYRKTDIVDDTTTGQTRYSKRGKIKDVTFKDDVAASYRKPSAEAIAARAIEAKIKTSSLDSVSNEELQVYLDRRTLETRYKDIMRKDRDSGVVGTGRSMVRGVIKSSGDEMLRGAAREFVVKPVLARATKGAKD